MKNNRRHDTQEAGYTETVNVRLTSAQYMRAQALTLTTGVTVSDILRHGIDSFERENGGGPWLSVRMTDEMHARAGTLAAIYGGTIGDVLLAGISALEREHEEVAELKQED